MKETEYDYKVQYKKISGSDDWVSLIHPEYTNIIDARALKRRCERMYGKRKNIEYRIVRRPVVNWEPCE